MSRTPLTKENLAQVCLAAGLPAEAVERTVPGLMTYLELLKRWNQVMNLVGPDDWPDIVTGLAADSWPLAAFIEDLGLPDDPLTLDLGAGAGLPGLPLRLLWPQGRYIMVEIRKKRAAFLQTCLAAMRLPGVSARQGRAEEIIASRPAADLIISRAFRPWPALLELVRPGLAPTGRVIIMANAPAPDEPGPGWRVAAERSYQVSSAGQARARHLWAMGLS